MLANRKQQVDIYQQQQQQQHTPPLTRSLPKLDVALRVQCLITVALVAVAAIFLTVRSETIIRAGYDLVQIKSEALNLQKENQLLQLDIAKLKSPQRIQYIATAELGMVIPQKIYCATGFSQTTQSESDKIQVSQVVNSTKVGKNQ